MLKSIYLFQKWRNKGLCKVFCLSLFMALSGVCDVVNAQQQTATMTKVQDCIQSVDPLLVESFFPVPEKMVLISPVCERHTDRTHSNKALTLEYSDTVYRPRIYGWQEWSKKWVGLVSTMNRVSHTVASDSADTYSILAVFADGRDAYEGTASWYAHKRYPEGSATNLFPIDTKLKVTNISNNKSTTVTVTSTWTNNDEKRIIDLVSTAFKKIAKLGEGLIKVRIERVEDPISNDHP